MPRSTNLVKFYQQWREHKFQSLEAGYPIGEFEDFIEIRGLGDQDKTVVDRKVKDQDKLEYREQWALYQAGLAQIPTGTPLTSWAQLSPSEVQRLHGFNIYTIEALVAVDDLGLQNIGPGARELQKRATHYLEHEIPRSAAAAARSSFERGIGADRPVGENPAWSDEDAGRGERPDRAVRSRGRGRCRGRSAKPRRATQPRSPNSRQWSATLEAEWVGLVERLDAFKEDKERMKAEAEARRKAAETVVAEEAQAVAPGAVAEEAMGQSAVV